MAETVVSSAGFYVHKLESGKKTIRYCEGGTQEEHCSTLGRSEGYSVQQWKSIAKVCSYRAWLDPKITPVIYAGSTLIGSLFGFFGTVAGAGVGVLIAPSGNPEAMDSASRKLNGLLDPEAKFVVNPDNFMLMREGLKDCTKLYDSTPAYWLEDCNSDPQCKLDLGKNLCFTQDELLRFDAFDLFFLKNEFETPFILSGEPVPSCKN